jgi:signal peptidase I
MSENDAAKGARDRSGPGGRRPYLLAVVAAIIVFILVAPVRVQGDNMAPALNDGDVVILLKESYYDAQLPEYGDVLCFKRSFAPPSAQGSGGTAGGSGKKSYRFARVAGLPGDELSERDGALYRNGKKLNGIAAAAGVLNDEAGAPMTVRKVGPGEVFVLNDDPGDTLDSRDSAVETTLENARGKAVFRIWPLSGFGTID